MIVYNGIEILLVLIIGKGMILFCVNKFFDYEVYIFVDLVVKWFYFYFILLKFYK